MTGNSSANSIILILFAFSDNFSAENSNLSAESGLRGLSFLESMPHNDLTVTSQWPQRPHNDLTVTSTTIFYYISLYFTIFHCISRYFTIFHYISLYFTIFHYISLYFTIFHCISLYFTIFHYISLHFTIFHYISLYFTIFHHFHHFWENANFLVFHDDNFW